MSKLQMKLNKDEQALFDSFNEKEREFFLAMPSDEERKAYLDEILELSTTDDLGVEMEEDVIREEDVPIYPVGRGPFRVGKTVKARFLGVRRIFSKEKKKHWDTRVVEGITFYINDAYIFEHPKTGKEFGLFESPMLKRVLRKTHTKASNPNIERNPLVAITYDGLITDPVKLKNEYNFELQEGDGAHAIRCAVEKAHKDLVTPYSTGTKCWLEAPLPKVSNNKKLTAEEQDAADWERQQRLANPVNNAGELGSDVDSPKMLDRSSEVSREQSAAGVQ